FGICKRNATIFSTDFNIVRILFFVSAIWKHTYTLRILSKQKQNNRHNDNNNTKPYNYIRSSPSLGRNQLTNNRLDNHTQESNRSSHNNKRQTVDSFNTQIDSKRQRA